MTFLRFYGTSVLASVFLAGVLAAQDPPAPAPADPAGLAPIAPQQAPPDKRIFGVLPNYRTANESAIYTPITTKQKFIIASKDSFDYPLVLVAGGVAGLSQLTNSNPSFGQGMEGYAHRLATGYADQVIGNMMTEGLFPMMLREDPRYFRRGYGSKWSRAWYAATRVFVTRTDSGGTRFNFSEVVGNSVAAAIGNTYEPDGRDVDDNIQKLGMQIGIDAFSQVLKEFWPDIKHKMFQHRTQDAASAP
ncbi:MAG TPA: hypothetical protein VMB25_20945 [Bryobacteraceae bacterium]|nr:hypothetical protein [Bryobacteraceae bacterium]